MIYRVRTTCSDDVQRSFIMHRTSYLSAPAAALGCVMVPPILARASRIRLNCIKRHSS
ncbi:small glutamine-rich tetratricopeptide repeat-containing protein alpha-like isoform 1 [Moniliophthora roreri]|nr:small glutamine-rich tetratricopeptide repeat-containing protein alpha-like isoform 1 [Moniliophthora roreri]